MQRKPYSSVLAFALVLAMLMAAPAAIASAAESDVNGDGNSDLVTLRPNGIGYVYPGGAGGSQLQFDSGLQSFVDGEGKGTLSPATFDGTGHFVIDVADVTGEGRADLVTVTTDGDVHVYPGKTDKTFATVVNSDLNLYPAPIAYRFVSAGPVYDEPIAVADVDNNGRADLVAYNNSTRDIEIYPGKADGSFEAPVVNPEADVYSALGGAWGENFVDVADVTGDGKADLISLPVWQNVTVRPGKVAGEGKPGFGEPVTGGEIGAIDSSLEDGVGYEPIGAGDVTGDGKADLALAKGESVYVFPGEAAGTFGKAAVSWSGGGAPSTLFGAASGFEFVGLLDVNKDGRADVVGAHSNGSVFAVAGQTNGTFSGNGVSFGGTFKSTRQLKNQDSSGNEIVIEKPITRRWGCSVTGCDAQRIPTGLRRIFALDNENLDIDGVDDERVDVDVAVIDNGVDLQHEDLNVVDGIDCVEASAENGYQCESDSRDDGDMGDPTDPELFAVDHGTSAALKIGALDNHRGGVGVAPGARIWSIKWLDPTALEQGGYPEVPLDAGLAAVKWVIATHEDGDPVNDIEVMTSPYRCHPDGEGPEGEGPKCPDGFGGPKSKALEAAIDEAVELGVVLVASTSNFHEDVDLLANRNEENEKNYLISSAISDSDGLPGENGPKVPTCRGVLVEGEPVVEDDHRDPASGYGEEVDVASPGGCGSAAYPLVSGAAAVLASAADPDSRDDFEAVRDDMVAAGNEGWTDTSPDGVRESLLDVHDEGVFDPDTLPGCERPGVPEVESDVDGNGRSDLVTLRADGRVFVHPGGTDRKFGAGVESFGEAPEGGYAGEVGDSPLDPAQYDGEGDRVVDVADVTGDGCADLVTLNADGNAYVYPGRPDLTLGFAVETASVPAADGDEAISAADVNGDTYADLIAYDGEARKVMVYPGAQDGSFGTGIAARSDIASALRTGAGHYFLDAADVTGDGRADLVSMHASGDLSTFAGQVDGTFAAATVSQSGAIEPAMDDSVGYEPVGLGDVNGDGRADLTLVKSGTTYTYPAQSGGEVGKFGSPANSFGGGVSSTTFKAGIFELIGVMNVDGDGYADVAGRVTSGDKIYVGPGQSSGSFGAGVASSGAFPSTQHFQNQNSTGNEFVFEKPSWRRRGCESTGCGQEGKDTIGIFRPSNGTWNLRNSNSAGAADLSFAYNWGAPWDVPISGDWDGDGDDTIGMYRPGDEAWYLRNTNSSGATDVTFKYSFTGPEEEIPVVGDWDGDGIDTIGMYRPVVGEWSAGEGTWNLRNSNSAGAADLSFVFYAGGAGDIPVVGDWDGDGKDTIGIFRPSNGTWNLRNSNSAGAADLSFAYNWGAPWDVPISGDWDGDGDDTIGMYRPGDEAWYLRNTNSSGATDVTFKYSWGAAADLPVTGDWDGA